MRNDAIGMFDSGVGGLSIWREIRKQLPFENTVYFADQAHLPYGDKSNEFLKDRTRQIIRFLKHRGA